MTIDEIRATLTAASHEADWRGLGRAAGPLRNQHMIDTAKSEGCHLCIAFQGGRGTDDCVRRAEAAGFEIRRVTL